MDADEVPSADSTFPGAKSWDELGAKVLFEKVLTSSDINPQGRIVVPKVVCFRSWYLLSSTGTKCLTVLKMLVAQGTCTRAKCQPSSAASLIAPWGCVLL